MFTFSPATSATPAPGQYHRTPGDRRDTIVICCPGCEGEFRLAKHYQIGAGGIVNPAIRCPFFGCGWVKASQLQGYPHGAKS